MSKRRIIAGTVIRMPEVKVYVVMARWPGDKLAMCHVSKPRIGYTGSIDVGVSSSLIGKDAKRSKWWYIAPPEPIKARLRARRRAQGRRTL